MGNTDTAMQAYIHMATWPIKLCHIHNVAVRRPVFDCKLQTLGGDEPVVFGLTVGAVEMSSVKWIW